MLVGKSEKKFTVHRSLVCKSSEFFEASTSIRWKEGQENTVRLPECEPSTFTTYIGWLYTSEVDLLEADEKEVPWVDKDGTTLTQRLNLTRRAIDCYALGDMVLDNGFLNAVVDELISISEKCNTVPGHESVKYAWDKIPKDGKLADLLVDFYAVGLDVKEFDAMLPELPAEFVARIARAGIRGRLADSRGRKPTGKLKCHYHKHGSLREACTSDRCMCAECLKVKGSGKGA